MVNREKAERLREEFKRARANSALEGVTYDAWSLALQERVARGEISDDQARDLVRERYGAKPVP
jgi:uncharacterized membrane protein